MNSMNSVRGRAWLSVFLLALAVTARGQAINSTYADLTLAGNWQAAKQYAAGNFGSDIYYDPSTGTLLLIGQRAGLRKVGDIAKFFAGSSGPSRDAAGVLSSTEFPLPGPYTERASRDMGKGTKPPKMWDMKEGEGNPVWFYASQLFDEYRIRDVGGSSEITEQFDAARVTKAEQRTVSGGDFLLFEVETDRPPNDAAMKKFRMPAGLKDQHIRYGWVQFAPGGIASGQGVLSVAFATPANSQLTIDEVAKQVSAAKIKPL